MTHSKSEKQTLEIAKNLAKSVFGKGKVFIQLSGALGAGKTTFARGFIQEWLKAAGEDSEQAVTSPSYNVARVIGNKTPVAHLDLYRIKRFEELEAIGFEQYFYDYPCCIVEWLEQVPEAVRLKPDYSILVELKDEGGSRRLVSISR